MGSQITLARLQSANVLLPIEVTEVPIVTDFNFVSPANKLDCMLSTELPIMNDSIFVHPENKSVGTVVVFELYTT